LDVVLLNPPFYRFLGSHNDKIPLSLAYLSAFLSDAGISHTVYNADHTGARGHWSLKWMFDHYETFVDGVNGKGSLYGEVLETVLSWSPRTVVIMGGDPLIPTTEWGNPFIAAHFSRLLRKRGIFTVGLGPFYRLDARRFLPDFDCLFTGEPSSEILGVLRKKRRGILPFSKMALDVPPNLAQLYPSDQKTDTAVTSLGCRYQCSFCLSGQFYRSSTAPVRYVEEKTVTEDLRSRKEKSIYLLDLNFPFSPIGRLRALDREFKKNRLDKEFTVDGRADCLNEEKVKWLRELNVKRVKLGIEAVDPKTLERYNKKINLLQTERAIRMLKNHGIGVIFYLILGPETTEDTYLSTREFLRKWEPDYIVPNLLAYDLKRDYRYDTEFSPLKLKEWGVPRTLYYKYLTLQKKTNPTVGKIID